MEQEQEVKIEPTENKNMTPYAIGAVVIVVAVAGVFLLSKGSPTSTPKPSPKATTTQQVVMGDETSRTPDTTTTTASGAATTTDASVKTIEIEAGSFYYKPNEIRVKKGEKVKVVIKSVSMMHDFNVEGLDVKSPIIKSGETGTVEFTASKAGTFEFYCSVGQHRQNGQVGKLIVE